MKVGHPERPSDCSMSTPHILVNNYSSFVPFNQSQLPTCYQPPPSITICNSSPPNRHSAQMNTHEQLLSLLEIKELLLPLLTVRSSV